MFQNPVINAHTHTPSNDSVVSWDVLGKRNQTYQKSGKILYSASIHPWDAELVNPNEVPNLLQACFEEMQPVAIGECGLDRVCKVSFQKQVAIFKLLLSFANEKNLPVIIHSVKSWSDMFNICSKFGNLRYILHDFRANELQTRKLLEFDTYFSFGKVFDNPTKKLHDSISIIPKERILIETDDSSLPVEHFLKRICVVLQVNKEDFRKQIISNTQRAFRLEMRNGEVNEGINSTLF